jgi:alpha-galactosidase
VRHLGDADRAALARWVALYKQLRGRLHTGQVWLGEAGDGVLWQAHGDADGSEVLLLVYRLTPTTHRNTPSLRLPMLRPDGHYTIERLDPTPPDWTSSPLNDAVLAAGAQQAVPPAALGGWLQAVGLPLPRMNAESALIYRLRHFQDHAARLDP